MRIPTPGFLFTAFVQVCRRFPGTMLCAVLGTIACFILIENSGNDSEEFFARNWITCQLGLPFLTALVAFSESKNWNEKRVWLVQAIGVVLLVGCWFWLDTKSPDFERHILPQYIALLLVMHLAVAVAPYLNRRSVRDFWEYNRELFANLVVGAAFSMILFAGLALAILAMDNLFNIHFNERIYARLFVLLAGVFNTTYFLYHFPPQFVAGTEPAPEKTEGNAYNWVFRNLCKYILIPIVILYFLILYAYGAKIGIEATLPKGWVSSLVIGFSVAGILTYLLNFYLAEEDDSALVTGFKRWFWWVVLPLTILLFIAIGKRISDYGVTEERYLVAQLGVWLAAACLYFLFSKNDNIKFIPISLGLFALVWAFGPLSAFSVSERSQKGILIEILTRNGRFENGKMKPGTIPVTEPEALQVSSAIEFLESRNALSDLLPTPKDSAWNDYGGVMDWLKIETETRSKTSTLTISPLNTSEPFDLRGYDFAYMVELNPNNDEEIDRPGYFFRLSDDGKMLEWRQTKNGETTQVEMFSFNPAMQKWLEKKEKEESYNLVRLPLSERTINFTGRHGSVRFIAQELQIEVEGQEKRLNYCNGWVLLKEK